MDMGVRQGFGENANFLFGGDGFNRRNRRADRGIDLEISLLKPDPAGFEARHVEDIRDYAEQILATLPYVAAIAGIFRRSQGAECFLMHQLGKADDGVERRPQFVTYIGEKFGFGQVRGLGLGLLFQIFLGEIGELLRLQFQGLAGLAQVGDGRQEAAF